MARFSAQCDLVSSYMDGVHVKIAEAYKPPRKVTLPAAYNNKFPEATKITYDFSLEKSVLEKVAEWKKVRLAIIETRRARFEEIKKRDEETPTPSPPLPTDSVLPLPVKVAPAPETTILTPQTLPPSLRDLHSIDIHVKSNGLVYADFDNDTSSPFDNVELKTINDMEELAQVLQPSSQWNPQTKIENILHEMSEENCRDHQTEEKKNVVEKKVDERNNANSENDAKSRDISIIVQELQRELARPYMENWKPWPDLESPNIEVVAPFKRLSVSESTESLLPNPIEDLPEADQKFAKHLEDMGFPLPRAARAIGDLGGEVKKVVEYLLAVQSLEELGIPGDEAEKALSLNQYDQERAKKYHENLSTLKQLGFPEDEASKALLKFDIDRDKALDFLCA